MKGYAKTKALVIGVSRYADPQYDLSYARSDAEAMAKLLGNDFGFDQVWTLYDKDATKANITRFFEQDLQRTDEDDGILIFFAGHGITVMSGIGDDRGFLVPHDGDPKRPYANLSLTAIRDDYLPMIPAKHVLLIVDACYGGLALRDVATVERPQSIDDSVLAELTRRDRKVRQVLAAGTKDQRVLDGGLFGHSVFTGRLIEALREADPYITADHVGVHVRERVARDSLDRKHRQTPQFGYLTGGDGTFVFGCTRCRPDKKMPAHGVPRPSPPAQLLSSPAISTMTHMSPNPLAGLTAAVRDGAQSFVTENRGHWTHSQWLDFVKDVRFQHPECALGDDALGDVLEAAKREYARCAAVGDRRSSFFRSVRDAVIFPLRPFLWLRPLFQFHVMVAVLLILALLALPILSMRPHLIPGRRDADVKVWNQLQSEFGKHSEHPPLSVVFVGIMQDSRTRFQARITAFGERVQVVAIEEDPGGVVTAAPDGSFLLIRRLSQSIASSLGGEFKYTMEFYVSGRLVWSGGLHDIE